MTMELDDCITKDCSTIYRFQFASIAFLCGVYLPFTFHSSIWSLYIQPFTPVNCTAMKNPLLSSIATNITLKASPLLLTRNYTRPDCCGCHTLLNGENTHDKRLLAVCHDWLANLNGLDVRKATILDEVTDVPSVTESSRLLSF